MFKNECVASGEECLEILTHASFVQSSRKTKVGGYGMGVCHECGRVVGVNVKGRMRVHSSNPQPYDRAKEERSKPLRAGKTR